MTRRRRELTVAEVAAVCGVSPITVRVWITRGYLRRNAHGRIDGATLIDYLDRRLQRGDPVPAEVTRFDAHPNGAVTSRGGEVSPHDAGLPPCDTRAS